MAYNGWTNYETWNVCLWVGNSEEAYRTVCAYPEGRYTAASAQRMAEALYPDGTPDMADAAAFDAVNWEEVAEAWNEDYEDDADD